MGLMYTPHTVTIVNAVENAALDMTYHATVLRGVFLDTKHSSLAQALGAKSADSAELFVPFDVSATDAVTGEARTYADPSAYRDALDKRGLWTLEPSGDASAVTCYFVKGALPEGASYKTLRQGADYVYRVSSVQVRDFGDEAMQHWQIGGV